MNHADIITEIEFAESQAHEFKGYIAPMLRFVVAVNPEVDRDLFVAACVEKGYHAATAKQCFYIGRKWAIDNS